MSKGIVCYYSNDKKVWMEHKPDYDITILCDSAYEMEKAVKMLIKTKEKPVVYAQNYKGLAVCPNCGYQMEIGQENWEKSYCCRCGQKLSWNIEAAEQETKENDNASR